MTLPEGVRFLELGWWLVHLVAVWLVFSWGYREGRTRERRDARRGDKGDSPTPGG
jgi:hypothetical protein